MIVTPSRLKIELERLKVALDECIESSVEKLTSRRRLERSLLDSGFLKVSADKYSINIKNRKQSYVSIKVILGKRNADIVENHMVIVNGKEVPSSSIDKEFKLISVRYNRVLGELLNRIQYLSENIDKEYNNDV